MIDHSYLEKIRQEEKAIRASVNERLLSYIVAAFGLVAGLAWNDAISSLITYIFPTTKGGIIPKFIYALVITLFVVIITYFISKWLTGEKKDDEKDKLKEQSKEQDKTADKK